MIDLSFSFLVNIYKKMNVECFNPKHILFSGLSLWSYWSCDSASDFVSVSTSVFAMHATIYSCHREILAKKPHTLKLSGKVKSNTKTFQSGKSNNQNNKKTSKGKRERNGNEWWMNICPIPVHSLWNRLINFSSIHPTIYPSIQASIHLYIFFCVIKLQYFSFCCPVYSSVEDMG